MSTPSIYNFRVYFGCGEVAVLGYIISPRGGWYIGVGRALNDPLSNRTDEWKDDQMVVRAADQLECHSF